jgi:energy-coupling factor transporter transmembrane protein EcfT
MKLYENLFILLNYAWYILFSLAYFDIWHPAKIYLQSVTFYFKIFVSVFLIYFFNPWNTVKFNDFHRTIVFTAGTFILFSEGLMFIFNKMTTDAANVTAQVAARAKSATDIVF